MQLVKVWDYFMRRKLLLLVVIAALALVGILGEIMSSRRAEDNLTAEIPRTGEVLDMAECETEASYESTAGISAGRNSADEVAEVADTARNIEMPKIDDAFGQSVAEKRARNESAIITAGGIALIVTALGAKFIFDRYVR